MPSPALPPLLCIPLVVISGQVVQDKIGDDAFQETDMIGVSRPIVKHSYLVTRAEDIAETIAKAFYIANTGRPGPVVVDIPKDVTDPNYKVPYKYPDKVKIRSYQPTTKGHSGQIKRAVKQLLGARKPMIYAGGGVIMAGASEQLRKLARRLNFPVTNTLMGLGSYPGSDPQFLGMLGMHGTFEANTAMHYADVILAVGARFDDRVTNTPDKFCPDATIIHIDVDPTSISKTVPADIPIVGSCDQVLDDILDGKRRSPTRTPWRSGGNRSTNGGSATVSIPPAATTRARGSSSSPRMSSRPCTRPRTARHSSPPTWASTRCLWPSTTCLTSRAGGSTPADWAPWAMACQRPWA